MKEATPFNPIVIPNLAIPTSEPQLAKLVTKSTQTRRRKAGPRLTSHKVRTRRALDPKQSAIRFARKVSRKAKTSWKRIKGGITARLAHLDREQLKKVLLACGIAAAAVAAIITLIKLTPVIVAILAVVGLGVVLQMWERLRVTRIPV